MEVTLFAGHQFKCQSSPTWKASAYNLALLLKLHSRICAVFNFFYRYKQLSFIFVPLKLLMAISEK